MEAEELPQVTQDLSLDSSSQNSLKHTVPESTPIPHPPDAISATKTCIYLFVFIISSNQWHLFLWWNTEPHLVIKCNFAHRQGHIFNCVWVCLFVRAICAYVWKCIYVPCIYVHLHMAFRAYDRIYCMCPIAPLKSALVKRIHLTIKPTWAVLANLQWWQH